MSNFEEYWLQKQAKKASFLTEYFKKANIGDLIKNQPIFFNFNVQKLKNCPVFWILLLFYTFDSFPYFQKILFEQQEIFENMGNRL